jgi:hypothetical protein
VISIVVVSLVCSVLLCPALCALSSSNGANRANRGFLLASRDFLAYLLCLSSGSKPFHDLVAVAVSDGRDLKMSVKGLRKVGYLDHHFLLSDRSYEEGQEQCSKDDWEDQDEDNEIEEDEEGSEVDSKISSS